MKIIALVLVFVLIAGLVPVSAQTQHSICFIYFTGIGCPHCAKTDPLVLGKLPLARGSDLVIIEYEIYKSQVNVDVMKSYNAKYNISKGVPQIVVDQNLHIAGDRQILSDIQDLIDSKTSGNECLLINGSAPFGELNLNELPGKPNIWRGDRILLRAGPENASEELLKAILTSDDVSVVISGKAEIIDAEPVPLSGSKIRFSEAAKVGGWTVQWGNVSENRVGDRWMLYYVELGVKIILGLAILSVFILLAKSMKQYIKK